LIFQFTPERHLHVRSETNIVILEQMLPSYASQGVWQSLIVFRRVPRSWRQSTFFSSYQVSLFFTGASSSSSSPFTRHPIHRRVFGVLDLYAGEVIKEWFAQSCHKTRFGVHRRPRRSERDSIAFTVSWLWRRSGSLDDDFPVSEGFIRTEFGLISVLEGKVGALARFA